MKFIAVFLCMLIIATISFGQKTSKDNYTGQFTDDNSWVGGTAPALAIGAEDVTINGYISYGTPPGSSSPNFNLLINTSGQTLTINDTLVLYSDMFPRNNPMSIVINSGGLLIIFGDITIRGSLTVNGTLVVGGTSIGITSNKGSFSGSGNVYAYNYGVPGFVPSGQDKSVDPDLQNDLPDVYEFLTSGGTSPLPVIVVFFKANKQNDAVRLEWATSLEENFDYFTIERSLHGKMFNEYGKIFSKTVYSSVVRKYEFIDEMPFNGLSYYRLKATDFDGSYEYHGVVAINMENIVPDILIYPNPATDNHVSVSYSGESETIYKILKITGEIIETGMLQPGVNSIEFNSLLDQGIYFFNLEGSIISRKFIVR